MPVLEVSTEASVPGDIGAQGALCGDNESAKHWQEVFPPQTTGQAAYHAAYFTKPPYPPGSRLTGDSDSWLSLQTCMDSHIWLIREAGISGAAGARSGSVRNVQEEQGCGTNRPGSREVLSRDAYSVMDEAPNDTPQTL